VRGEVLFNIVTEFGIPMTVSNVIKSCLNETYSNVRIGKNMPDIFPVQNGLKQGDALLLLPLNFAGLRICLQEGRSTWIRTGN